MLQLNVGSGQRPFGKPWVNVDCQAIWNPDVLLDFGNPLVQHPWEPGSVDTIVLHHVLEHYGTSESSNMLKFCHSLLGKRGSLLVFVPNMSVLAGMYLDGLITSDLYMANVYGAYMGNEADRHKWGYTRESLRTKLVEAGFTRVSMFDWRYLFNADIAKDNWILGMEAIK